MWVDRASGPWTTVHVRERREALAQQESAAAECTAPFRAPELWDTPSQCDLDERVDVWSLGCTVFAACAGGRSPFEYSMGHAGGSLALAVMSGKYAWPEAATKKYPAEVRDVVKYALNKDWKERPTATDVRLKVETAMESVRRRGREVGVDDVGVSVGV